MKLLGNSVSVPVVHALAAAIIETGCFSELKNFSEKFSAEENQMHSIDDTSILV